MRDFDFCSPTRFVFGKGSELRAGELLKEAGATRVLVHYGSSSAKKSGLLDRVLHTIKDAGLTAIELAGAKPNPESSLVYTGITLARAEHVDSILAIGGGSAIDSAKAIAVGVPYEGDFWDFYTAAAIPQKALPVGVVLTIPAAGSEGSTSSVITHDDGKLKRGMNSQLNRPRFALMNPELTYTLPAYQTACGIVDIMAHTLERYFSRERGVDLTDRLCESILLSVIQNAPIVLQNPTNYEARANIMWAGTLAHNHLVGLGREGDWCSHQLEHELSALYGVAHGAGLAVILPAYMRYQYKKQVPLFAQLAERVFGVPYNRDNPEETALQGIFRFESFLHSIDMPLTFAELGAKKEDIPALAAKVKVNATGECGGFIPLKKDDFIKVYELACR